MKTIGLIGGTSWESTAIYYRLMNEMVKERLGGLNSAQLLIWSFNFEEIAVLQAEGRWDEATEKMVEAGLVLKAGGAKALVICANTMHKMAHEVYRQTNLPVIHIADATAGAIRKLGLKKVGLLATKFTMEQDFYTGRLSKLHKIETIIPDEEDRNAVHRIIYDELCKGIINPAAKNIFLEIIGRLVEQGAEGIVFGCTEICLLLNQSDISLPVFDTAYLHAAAAVDFALSA